MQRIVSDCLKFLSEIVFFFYSILPSLQTVSLSIEIWHVDDFYRQPGVSVQTQSCEGQVIQTDDLPNSAWWYPLSKIRSNCLEYMITVALPSISNNASIAVSLAFAWLFDGVVVVEIKVCRKYPFIFGFHVSISGL